MFRSQKYILNLLKEKERENENLKLEMATLRIIAGNVVDKAELEGTELKRCDKLACKACAYSARFFDSIGGYVYLCTKNSSCPDFYPKGISAPI